MTGIGIILNGRDYRVVVLRTRKYEAAITSALPEGFTHPRSASGKFRSHFHVPALTFCNRSQNKNSIQSFGLAHTTSKRTDAPRMRNRLCFTVDERAWLR